MRVVVSCGLAALVLTAASSSHAETPWYVSGSLGAYFRENAEPSASFNTGASPAVRVDGSAFQTYDPGLAASLALGYRIDRRVRIEAEVGGDWYDRSQLTPSVIGSAFANLNGTTFDRRSGGDYRRYTVGGNAFFDIGTYRARYTPYVGVGMGAAFDHSSKGLYVSGAGQQLNWAENSGASGYFMTEAGLSIRVADHWSVAPAYRYMHYFSGWEAAHIAKLGVRYSF